MAKILITSNGPHSPETWAMATAEVIFDIDSSVVGDRKIAAQKLQTTIAEALVPHHTILQDNERNRLHNDVAHARAPFNVDEYLDGAINDIVTAAKGTPWEGHFAKADVQASVRHVVANHLMTAQHIERSWHVDRNPNALSQ